MKIIFGRVAGYTKHCDRRQNEDLLLYVYLFGISLSSYSEASPDAVFHTALYG